MKTFRFFATLLVIALCAGFTSCSDDDEEENSVEISLANLQGTWDMIKCYGWEYDDNNQKENWTVIVLNEFDRFLEESLGQCLEHRILGFLFGRPGLWQTFYICKIEWILIYYLLQLASAQTLHDDGLLVLFVWHVDDSHQLGKCSGFVQVFLIR